MKMKRYIAFSGDDYQPCGGAADIVGDFDDLEDAMKIADRDGGSDLEFFHVLDVESGCVYEHPRYPRFEGRWWGGREYFKEDQIKTGVE